MQYNGELTYHFTTTHKITISPSAGLIVGFSQPIYSVVEDNDVGSEGMLLTVCVVMMSSIEIEREFSFYVSVTDITATGSM